MVPGTVRAVGLGGQQGLHTALGLRHCLLPVTLSHCPVLEKAVNDFILKKQYLKFLFHWDMSPGFAK